MDMFLYKDFKTSIHRLDPRAKLLLLGLVFAVGGISKNIVVLSVVFGLVLIQGGVGKILMNLVRIRIVLIMISIFSILIWAIAGLDETGFSTFPLEGVFYGIMTAVRTNLMIVAGVVYLSTTRIEEITQGLVKLRLPYRGAFAFSTAIRLVPLIVATSNTIIQAQKSRGLDLNRGTIFAKIRNYTPLMIPILVSVIRGTNVFSMALESKGFGYSSTRSNYLELKFTWKDLAICLLGMGVLAAVAYVQFNAAAFGILISIFPWADYS